MTGAEHDDDRVTEIVIEALERLGDERNAYLDAACAGDRELRDEVDSLLAEDLEAETEFLAVPAPERVAGLEPHDLEDTGENEPLPDRVGPYRILDRLGRGGMGTVYLAEQSEPVRRVALKVIRRVRQPTVRRRFTTECQALARLNHPNIAAMYEVGTAGEDQPYVAMEWVDGQSITEWCDARTADLATRLQLFLGVCAAIGHAHEKGILHCDLKPSNVLVTEIDGMPVAKVIDFGIARALGEPLVRGQGTLTGESFVGSPVYISPEATKPGGRRNLDTRSDVYSLGLILYELISSTLPFDPREHTIGSLLHDLSERDPVAPSVRFAALDPVRARRMAARRGVGPRGLERALRGDLDAIVCKATARDPADRYSSPGELADDLGRHLTRRPVAARDRSQGYVLTRFLWRNVGVAAAVLLMLAALGGGVVARTVEARRANEQAERARAALTESEQIRDFVLDLFAAADPERAAGDAITVRELLEQGAGRLDRELADQPLVRARFLQTIGAIYTKLGLFAPAEELVTEALEIRQANLADHDPEVLESRRELALIYRREGKLDEAAGLLEEVLAAQTAQAEPDPRSLALTQNHLGNVYWRQERYEEAEVAHRTALEIRRSLPDAGGEVAISANNLGVLLLTLNRHAEALPLLEQAAERWAAELPATHSTIAVTLNNLGLVHRNLESWRQSESYFRQAAEIYQAAFGPSHREAIKPQRNLVVELYRRHRWDEALALSRTNLEAAESDPSDSVNLVRVLRAHGDAERLAGRLESAVATLRRGAALAEERFGAEHSLTRHVQTTLSYGLADAGDVAEAIAILQRIAADQDGALPPAHPSRVRTDAALGYASFAGERFADAERYWTRVRDLRTERLGERNVATLRAAHDLGRSIAAQARLDEAAKLLEHTLVLRQELVGNEHPWVADTAQELALVERERGNSERSRELLQQAVAIRRAIFPDDDRDLEESRQLLASLASDAAASGTDSG